MNNLAWALILLKSTMTLNQGKDSSPPPEFIAFFVLWILLGIVGSVFYRVASYETKKFWHPVFVIVSSLVFLGFGEFIAQGHLPIIGVLFVGLIAYLNLRNTRFCPICEKTLSSRGWSRERFCSKCGADLDSPPDQGNRPIG